MTAPQLPTWKQWLRDGATLIGLDDARQEDLRRRGGQLRDGAVRDLETIERGIRDLETRATRTLQRWREPKPKSGDAPRPE